MPNPNYRLVDPALIMIPTDAPPPTRALINSVVQHGILEPLHVIEVLDSGGVVLGYKVSSGRRRKLAIDRAKEIIVEKLNYWRTQEPGEERREQRQYYQDARERLATVPVFVSAEEEPEKDIILNTLRTKNPISEFESIQTLMSGGLSEKEISALTGMPVGTIRARARLASLNENIRRAVIEGNVAIGVAESVSKLSPQMQRQLVRILNTSGKVTAKDVRAVRSVAVTQITASLFESMPSMPPLPASSVPTLQHEAAPRRSRRQASTPESRSASASRAAQTRARNRAARSGVSPVDESVEPVPIARPRRSSRRQPRTAETDGAD